MTTWAQMPPVVQLLGDALSTDAPLACATWVHRNHAPTGPCRLAGENCDELAPRRVTDTPGQGAIGEHVLDREVFVTDHIEGAHQGLRGLVVEVTPHIGDLLVKTGHTPPLHLPIAAPFLP